MAEKRRSSKLGGRKLGNNLLTKQSSVTYFNTQTVYCKLAAKTCITFHICIIHNNNSNINVNMSLLLILQFCFLATLQTSLESRWKFSPDNFHRNKLVSLSFTTSTPVQYTTYLDDDCNSQPNQIFEGFYAQIVCSQQQLEKHDFINIHKMLVPWLDYFTYFHGSEGCGDGFHFYGFHISWQ